MMYQIGATYRHKKSDGEYKLVGMGGYKGDQGVWDRVVIYESVVDNLLYVRDILDFEKKFEYIKPSANELKHCQHCGYAVFDSPSETMAKRQPT